MNKAESKYFSTAARMDEVLLPVSYTHLDVYKRQATVRAAANRFGISKSTVHKDVTSRLRHLDPELFRRAQTVLERNKAERHLRGGAATRQKYAHPP